MPDDPSLYRPVSIGPIPADHPLLDTGPIVDPVAMYGPDTGRQVPEAGLLAGLMANEWLLRLAYPEGTRQVLEAQRRGADETLRQGYTDALKRALEAERERDELRDRMREIREVANRPWH